MTGADILSMSYEICGGISPANFLDGTTETAYKRLNTAYGHRILDILRVRVDKNASMQSAETDFISTVGLVAGDNGYNGEYAFPTDLLSPVRVEVSYDGITWRKASVYEDGLNQGSEFNEDQINGEFSQLYPAVNFERNSYKIRPLNTLSTIERGIKITYEKRQADFTDDTAPTEIEANLHDLLAYDLAEYELVSHATKYTPQQISMIRNKRAEVEQKFLAHYQSNLGNQKKVTIKYRSYK